MRTKRLRDKKGAYSPLVDVSSIINEKGEQVLKNTNNVRSNFIYGETLFVDGSVEKENVVLTNGKVKGTNLIFD